MKLSKRVAAAISIAALGLGAFSGVPAANAASQTTLTIGSIIEPKSWDPTQADLGHMAPLYQSVYDTLVLRTPAGTYVPNLATKWSFGPGSSWLQMDLRKGVKFSDGSEFNAKVAKANLDAFVAGNGPYSSTLAGVTTSVEGDYTIKIKLLKANPDILYYLATTDSYMASPKAIGTAELKTLPIGSGPYVYDKSSVPGSQLVFTANPGYWDKKKIKFKKIVFKLMTDVTARLNALLSGQIDATILDANTDPTAKARGMTEYLNNVDWQGLMILDRDGDLSKPLSDVRVRQAIGYSLDRAALLKAVQKGFGTVTQQPFGKASGAQSASLESYYSLDNAKAKSLLAAAGYPNGLTLDFPAWPDPTMRAVLGDQLAASGIKVNWVSVPGPEYRNQLKAKKFAIAVYQLGLANATAWVTINFTAAPDASWNVFGSKSQVVSQAIGSIQVNPSDKNVAAQAAKINDFLVKNAWFLPFYQMPQMFFTNSHVKTINSIANAVPYIYNYAPTGK